MGHLFEYLIGANIICFLAFAIDKLIARCKLNLRRIPEQTLFALIMLGPFGGLIGMIICCHKTRKASFWIRVILCCCLHLYLFIQFIQKKYEMMTNPGALGIDGAETQTIEANKYADSNIDSYIEDDIMPDHPDL